MECADLALDCCCPLGDAGEDGQRRVALALDLCVGRRGVADDALPLLLKRARHGGEKGVERADEHRDRRRHAEQKASEHWFPAHRPLSLWVEHHVGTRRMFLWGEKGGGEKTSEKKKKKSANGHTHQVGHSHTSGRELRSCSEKKKQVHTHDERR